MTSSVLTALGLDGKSLSGELITIVENGTADATFILSSIMDQQIKNKDKIILLLFHNTIGHYHAIGLKLGYNLFALQESKDLILIDGLKLILSSPDGESKFLSDENSLRNLYFEIRQHVAEMDKSRNVLIILEDISQLLLLDFKLSGILFFTHYIRTLLTEFKRVNVVCLVHQIANCEDCKIFSNTLKHVSNVIATVDDLKTGKAVDVTGLLTVKRTGKDLDKWNEQCLYHYQLLEKNIKIFAPGAVL